tara:strand:+ start:255 stop:497 length:243 start_codon:yes stop_codon:yes gene_type:complete
MKHEINAKPAPKKRFSDPRNIRLEEEQEQAVRVIMNRTPMNFGQAVRWLMTKGWEEMQREQAAPVTEAPLAVSSVNGDVK